MTVDNLNAIADKIRANFIVKNEARDKALLMSRELVRLCANSIRSMHRSEHAQAASLLADAQRHVAQLRSDLSGHPDLYHAGYVQEALKEYAEASALLALVRREALPEPVELGVEDAAYLNGLGEAVGELRRFILDRIRQGQTERCEDVLQNMDDIYCLLLTMDFPDAITGNLRRTTDMVRSVMEKTRGDLTFAVRQRDLESSLERLESRIQ
ncbi:MAG: haloacid dehalogenase [Chloroflexota bacterium]